MERGSVREERKTKRERERGVEEKKEGESDG